MKLLTIVYGHSVSVTGFRLGQTVRWDNRIVLTKYSSKNLNLIGWFWYKFFFNHFSTRYAKTIRDIWQTGFGILIELIQISELYKNLAFKFFVYVDLLAILYSKTFQTPYQPFFKSKKPFKRFFRFSYDRRQYNNSFFSSGFRRFGHFGSNSKTLVGFANDLNFSLRKKNLPRLPKKATFSLFAEFELYINRLLYFELCKSSILQTINRDVAQQLCYLSSYHRNLFKDKDNFSIKTLYDSAFFFPNVLVNFIIIRLRKWYKVAELFSRLKFKTRGRFDVLGYLVQAKGRLTKKQRASTYRSRFGATPFSSVNVPLYFYQNTYPLKYGASSVSISVSLLKFRRSRLRNNFSIGKFFNNKNKIK